MYYVADWRRSNDNMMVASFVADPPVVFPATVAGLIPGDNARVIFRSPVDATASRGTGSVVLRGFQSKDDAQDFSKKLASSWRRYLND